MRTKMLVPAVLLSGMALFGQTQPPQAAPAPAQETLKEPVYVRRFSAGASMSVLIREPVPVGSTGVVIDSPPFIGRYDTESRSRRLGWGVTAQVAVTERFAVNAGLFLRSAGYHMTSNITEGVDNPNTIPDERAFTLRHEDTRFKLYDLPVLVRFYAKRRHQSGPRVFFEGGGVVRRVGKIKTSIDTTINSGDTQCCNTTPATPAHRTVRGFVGGIGFQVIEPIGIRIVPEVRYTRWVDQTFNNLSTTMQRNQIEAVISLTF